MPISTANEVIRVTDKALRTLQAAALVRDTTIAQIIDDYTEWLLKVRFSRVVEGTAPLVKQPQGGHNRKVAEKAPAAKKRSASSVRWNCPNCGKRIQGKTPSGILPHFAKCTADMPIDEAVSLGVSDGWLVKTSGSIFLKRGSKQRRSKFREALEEARS